MKDFINRVANSVYFYIPGCEDVKLNLLEFLGTLLLGIAICSAPFIIKFLALKGGF